MKHAKSGHSETVKHETGLLASWHYVHTQAFWPYQHWSREVNNSAREMDWEPVKHPYLSHSLRLFICLHILPSAYALHHVAASPLPSAHIGVHFFTSIFTNQVFQSFIPSSLAQVVPKMENRTELSEYQNFWFHLLCRIIELT